MLRRLRYLRNVQLTDVEEYEDEYTHFRIWARYFPRHRFGRGVEYHFELLRSDPDHPYTVQAQCTLSGQWNLARKLNKATRADIAVANRSYEYSRVSSAIQGVGFARCGDLQIKDINEVYLQFGIEYTSA